MNEHRSPILLQGIHHVTAVSGDAQRTIDFYAGVLGLRLVKQTVNFDDPYTYHLYFGDDGGSPGTLVTFFPWGATAAAGREGTRQISGFAFSYPRPAAQFWKERLGERGINFVVRDTELDGQVIDIRDPDGIRIELVGTDDHDEAGGTGGGTAGSSGSLVPVAAALRSIHAVILAERDAEATGRHLVEDLGFRARGAEGPRTRYASGAGITGGWIDVVSHPDLAPGSMGRGIIHHVAFRTPDDPSQLNVRDYLLERGIRVTPVRDRQYFRSVYFEEPGGVLFEIATDTPGFAVDEPRASLGSALRLPPWLEQHRRVIQQALPVIVLPDQDASIEPQPLPSATGTAR